MRKLKIGFMKVKETTPSAFLNSRNSILISPAGCGKTDMIAKCVSLCNEGKQLILTHTHAGVRSILDKLKKYNVSSKFYSVQTIDGFCLKYSNAYPDSGSEKLVDKFGKINYPNTHKAINRIIDYPFGKEIVQNSYSRVFVDEYQDCSPLQHQFIVSLSKIIPCRILGDPMQGIFDFGKNEIVDFAKDVYPVFKEKHYLLTPWRWKNRNEKLGEWLLEVRKQLLSGNSINLVTRPEGVEWYEFKDDYSIQREKCFKALENNTYTIAILTNKPNLAHYISKQLGGKFSSMEEMEFKTLFEYCNKFDSLSGKELVLSLIEFIEKCMTNVSTELKTIKNKITANKRNISNMMKYPDICKLIFNLIDSKSVKLIFNCFRIILKNIDGYVYRKELVLEMIEVLKERINSHLSYTEIAEKRIDLKRKIGRKIYKRTVSRVLLVKGLEFDHTLIINADELNYKELYVALTRPSRRLSIFSKSEIINPFEKKS